MEAEAGEKMSFGGVGSKLKVYADDKSKWMSTAQLWTGDSGRDDADSEAYLKYGVPQNNLKKSSLLVKAARKIARLSINVAVIQSLVLRCNTHCPGQWLRTLLYPRIKRKVSKVGHEWQAFAVASHTHVILGKSLCANLV